jgi:signal transduction histidine kinase/DNA-binding response OmpR family regulator
MTSSLKILILEDTAEDADLVQRLLKKESLNCTFSVAKDKSMYLKALDEFQPHVILSDGSLPEFGAMEALSIIKQRSLHVPFILVTGNVSEEFAVNVIKAGADDYILKDRLARLPAAIAGAVKQKRTEAEKLEIIKQSHNQIELAEERARLAIEAANIGTYDLDILTKHLITSQRYNEIFGFNSSRPHEEYIALIHPDDIEIRNEAYELLKLTGRLFYECRIIRKDKTVRWIRATGIIRKNEEGLSTRLIGSLMDITEAKYLLKQKDDFIGIASHELKTPVTTLKAYTHILEEVLRKRGSTLEVSLVRNVDKQVGRLSVLIANLLDVTKMASGHLEFNQVDFKFDLLVSEVIKDLQVTIEKKIIVESSAGDYDVHADKNKIEQTILNLVNNAVKFSPSADVIMVRTFVKNNKVNFEVEDFGIGVKKENMEKIFGQFYRADDDFAYTFPGLGLGLYISSEIIKGEGGQIWVRSEEGKRSIFGFSLPAV